jgi:hypothetical protein
VKKDIIIPPVVGVQVAVARKLNLINEYEWSVHLINRNQQKISNIMVTSSGYGSFDTEEIKTSTLRHFFEVLDANSSLQIELITPEVFKLSNEYWVSYWQNDQLFDKRFVFVPDSISDKNIIEITALGLEGVLHE